MSEQKRPQLPIGYWLKRADEVLTAQIGEAQQANGLHRLEWQILNVLFEVGAATDEHVATPLRPFADAAALHTSLTGLHQRGLVAGNGSPADRYMLTELGRRTHQAALELQKAVRQRATRGIGEADYTTAVRVLQQIVENLSGETTAQEGWLERDDAG